MTISLPQNDPQPASRQAALGTARMRWSYGAGMKPLAVAASVPSEERPRLKWAALLAEPASRIGLNDVANRAAWLTRGAVGLEAAVVEAPSIEATTAAHHAFANTASRLLAIDEATGAGLESTAAPISDAAAEEFVREAERRLLDVFGAASQDSALEGISFGGPRGRATKLQDFGDLFRKIPKPAAIATIEASGLTDDLFVQLRVAGPNPEMLVAVDVVPPGFPAALALSDGELAKDAAAGKRLFLADYQALSALVANPPKECWTPRAVFGVNRSGALEAVAIQCEPGGPVFTPGSAEWSRAKHVVQIADGNQHELIAHLGRTHLFVEPFVLAAHRELAPNHPVFRLLVPHFEGTIFINNSARGSLIADGGAIDLIFAGQIASSRAVTVEAVRSFDFAAGMLPDRIGRRNLGQIGEYPWRDDALLVWKAIERFVQSYVQRWYPSTADVLADSELQAWGALLSRPFDQGGITGFTPPTTPEGLAAALTLIVYTASAQHAAVNFPQFPDMSYAPLVSGAGWEKKPATGVSLGDLALYPPLELALQQAHLLYLLAGVHYTRLGHYAPGWFGSPDVDGPLVQAFQAELSTIEAAIGTKNATRKYKYSHLLPEPGAAVDQHLIARVAS